MRFERLFGCNHKQATRRLCSLGAWPGPVFGCSSQLGSTPEAPFASIIWIRFDGSSVLPHKTLSLCRPLRRFGLAPRLLGLIVAQLTQVKRGPGGSRGSGT